MRKATSLLFVAMLALLIASCWGNGGPGKAGKTEDCPWINKPPVFADAYAAIGVSSRGLSDAIARTQAETRGRTGIAFILETRVEAMTKNFLTASSSFRNKDAIISEDQFTQAVSRSVTKQRLNGALVKEYCVRKDGTIYALVVLKKDSLLKTAKDEIWDRAKKSALYNEYQADQALKELDAVIEKEYKASLQVEEASE